MYTECAPSFKHGIRDSGQVWVVLGDEMETENILPRLNIYTSSKQYELIWSVQPFTAKYVHKPQVQAQLLQLGKGLICYTCTSKVDLLQILKIFGQRYYSLVFHVGTAKKTNIFQVLEFSKVLYAFICNASTFC